MGADYFILTDCPNCEKPVVLRHAKISGRPFFGCTGYPNCNFTSGYDAALASLSARVIELEAQLRGYQDADARRLERRRRSRLRLVKETPK